MSMKGLHLSAQKILQLAGFCLACTTSVSGLSAQVQQPTSTFSTPYILQDYLSQQRKAAGLVSKSIQVGNVKWSYNEGGSRSSPSILLIHGLAGNRDNWSQFVVKIDVEDKLNIAGHSLGGSIATLYASQFPFDTQSLFLVNSAGIYKKANTIYSKDPYFLKNLIVSKPGDLDEVSHQLMQQPPSIPFKLKQAQEKVLIAQSSQTQKMIEQIITLNRIYTPDSFARLARNVEAPTLILWGKQDKIINVEAANELKSLLKRAEAPVILNNVGHMPIIEAEQEVANHYLPFLAKSQKFVNPLTDKLIPLN